MGAVVMPRRSGGGVELYEANIVLNDSQTIADLPLTGAPGAVVVWIDDTLVPPVILTGSSVVRSLVSSPFNQRYEWLRIHIDENRSKLVFYRGYGTNSGGAISFSGMVYYMTIP